MQPCIRIYYSTVHWRFNMFRLDYGRSPHAYVNQRLQIQLELLMMRYAARNMLSLQWTVE